MLSFIFIFMLLFILFLISQSMFDLFRAHDTDRLAVVLRGITKRYIDETQQHQETLGKTAASVGAIGLSEGIATFDRWYVLL